MVGAIEAASGRRASVVGKGGDFLFPFLLEHYHLDPRRTAVVGDRLDTDIALGKQGGMLTLLPLTGVSKHVEAAGPFPLYRSAGPPVCLTRP